MKNAVPLEISALTIYDVDDVLKIEHSSFSDPYSREIFLQEINNPNAFYLIGRDGENTVCYAGFWRIFDEGHIMSIAVLPAERRKGYASQILYALIKKARDLGIRSMTLEVRASNTTAQSLYSKFGFEKGGIRRGYYADNGEDALILWNRDITNIT